LTGANNKITRGKNAASKAKKSNTSSKLVSLKQRVIKI
jgi:hypothetical protein